jgi:hypothetical protein
MLLSALVIICIIIHYNYVLNVIKYWDNWVEESGNYIWIRYIHIVTLFSTGLWKFLMLEIIINSITCPPSLDTTFEMKSVGNPLVYSLDALCSFCSLFRMYTVLRLFEHYSHWTNERSRRVWYTFSFNFNHIHLVRSMEHKLMQCLHWKHTWLWSRTSY